MILKIKNLCFPLSIILSLDLVAQYDWKLTKERDGIKVYESAKGKSDFKSIRVECTMQGSYEKFIAVMNDVAHYKDWVYHTRQSYIVKKLSEDEYYYYTETSLPWPLSNRDAVFYSKTERDSLGRYLSIRTVTKTAFVPEKSGKVRVPYSAINWYVTRPSSKTIHISYIFEVNPGGYLPAWLVNLFADKGPYESFKKLEEALKK